MATVQAGSRSKIRIPVVLPDRDVSGGLAVPTTDPVAALRFCQALDAALHANGSRPLTDGDGVLDSPLGRALAPTLGSDAPDLSVVVPVYNEAENLPLLYERLCRALEGTGSSFEIVLVDDGSRDDSPSWMHACATDDPRVVVVELARNFGHQVAISAGLDHSRGRGVIVMDAALQDPPEALPHFIDKWREGYDVVYATRQKRKEHWLKRMAYAGFYRLLQRVANVEIPLDAGDFCIMDRRVVELLNGMPERNRFVRGFRSWVGFRQVSLPYEREDRHAGESKYTFARLIYLALDGLVSFSYVPLRVITVLGFGASIFSLVLATFYLIKKLTVGLNPPGFATLVVAVFFLAGIQLVTIGVIGEYVGRIFEEVKRRPLYVVNAVTRYQAR